MDAYYDFAGRSYMHLRYEVSSWFSPPEAVRMDDTEQQKHSRKSELTLLRHDLLGQIGSITKNRLAVLRNTVMMSEEQLHCWTRYYNLWERKAG